MLTEKKQERSARLRFVLQVVPNHLPVTFSGEFSNTFFEAKPSKESKVTVWNSRLSQVYDQRLLKEKPLFIFLLLQFALCLVVLRGQVAVYLAVQLTCQSLHLFVRIADLLEEQQRQSQCKFRGYLLQELNCIAVSSRTCLVNFLVKNGIKYLASSRVKPLSAFLLLILHSSSVSWSASTALPCQSTTSTAYFIWKLAFKHCRNDGKCNEYMPGKCKTSNCFMSKPLFAFY